MEPGGPQVYRGVWGLYYGQRLQVLTRGQYLPTPGAWSTVTFTSGPSTLPVMAQSRQPRSSAFSPARGCPCDPDGKINASTPIPRHSDWSRGGRVTLAGQSPSWGFTIDTEISLETFELQGP